MWGQSLQHGVEVKRRVCVFVVEHAASPAVQLPLLLTLVFTLFVQGNIGLL